LTRDNMATWLVSLLLMCSPYSVVMQRGCKGMVLTATALLWKNVKEWSGRMTNVEDDCRSLMLGVNYSNFLQLLATLTCWPHCSCHKINVHTYSAKKYCFLFSTAFYFQQLNMCKYLYEHKNIQTETNWMSSTDMWLTEIE
jgi:hypothetical protein